MAAAALLLWLIAGHTLPGQAAERILSFASDISVQRDGALIVTETIRVRSEGRAIRHGIYRDFPTRYRTATGTVNVGFDILAVTRDGAAEPYSLENRTNGQRVYIGDRGRTLAPGEHRYTIQYYTDRQLGFFARWDELYWNVTGNDWAFPIDQVRARLRLPEAAPFDTNELEAYTGTHGARGRDYRARIDAAGAAHFETTRPLRPGEGLTIAVRWPAGIIARPTTMVRLGYLLQDHAALLLGAGGVLLVALYYLLTWLRVGRDPAPGVIIPRFKPPAGLSPAALRYVRRMGYDARTFACAIIDLAVQGALSIDADGDRQVLVRAPDPAPPARTRGEHRILAPLFGAGDSIALTQDNHRRIRAAMQAHRQWLHDTCQRRYFRTNGWLLVPGVALSVLVVLTTGFSAAHQGAQFATLALWLAGWTFTVFVLLRRGRWLMAALFMLIEVAALTMFSELGGHVLTVTLLALIVLNVVFHYLIRAPTEAGRELLDHLEGLRMYMKTAEQDRLNLRNPPRYTPRHFEVLLPYALALDVDQQWAERFARHAARTARGDPSYQPSWYRGPDWRSFSDARRAGSLGASLSSAISAASTPPGSSSGGGGGGSSGGGGGGGGGGGW